ncbi:MAG TPA: hypothetical protein VIJ95_12450 [Hanamia sp.]
MKHYSILFSLLLFFPFLIQAQNSKVDSSKKSGPIKVNVIQFGRHSGTLYTINNEMLNNADMKSILNSYPKSAYEFHKYNQQKNIGLFVMLPIFLTSSTVGLIEAINNKNEPESRIRKVSIPFAISVGGVIGYIMTGIIANNHFKKAIIAYNSQF